MLKGLYKIQMGKQVSLAGGEVNATSILRADGYMVENTERKFPAESTGIIGGAGRSYISKYDAVLELTDGEATYEQLPYYLTMIDGITPAQDGAGTGYVYTFTMPHDTAPSPHYYTFEAGDEQQAYLLTGCVTTGLTIAGASEGAWTVKPTIIGQPKGTTTFTGSLSIPSVNDIIFGNTKLYIDDVGDGYGTTQLTGTFLGFSLEISDILRPVWTGDGNGAYYNLVKLNSGYKSTLTVTIEHDANAVAEYANFRDGTARAVQIINEGAALTTPGSYDYLSAILNLPGTITNVAHSDSDGNIQTELTITNHYDDTLGDRGTIVVVAELSALP